MNTESIAISATQKQRISNNELEYFFRVPSQLTNGKFGIYEALFKHKDNGADLHYHKEMTEVFTVLEGEFRFALQDEEKLLKKGDSIMIPPMTIHGFKSTQDNSKVEIVFDNCENREEFFELLIKLTAGQDIGFPISKLETFFNKHDQFSAEDIVTA